MRIRTVLIAAMALVLVAGVGAFALYHYLTANLRLPVARPACRITAQGTVDLDPDQLGNAATIAAVGLRRRLPEQAVVVALTTAMQESKLRNLPGGDRDSIGLFQQRPSQGWGSAEQIADARYAAGRFYDELLRIPRWQTLPAADAAQAVQRSAYPEAYQRWVVSSQVLTRAFHGVAGQAVSCTLTDPPAQRGATATATLATSLLADWGVYGTVAADTLKVTAADAQTGWRYADWLVARAGEHGVRTVRYGGLVWDSHRGGWKKDPHGTPGAVVAEVWP